MNDYVKRWRKQNPEKYSAHHKRRAYNKERFPVCESCGADGRLHAHHNLYEKPLMVEWLCPACHKQLHRFGETRIEQVRFENKPADCEVFHEIHNLVKNI